MTYSFIYNSKVKPIKTTEKLSINKISLITFVKSVLETVMKLDGNRMRNKKDKILGTVKIANS